MFLIQRLSKNVNIYPWHYVQLDIQSGLYHHGEEAERAGYTVTELFTLLRSTNARQRVFALDTLAAIIDKFWTGNL